MVHSLCCCQKHKFWLRTTDLENCRRLSDFHIAIRDFLRTMSQFEVDVFTRHADGKEERCFPWFEKQTRQNGNGDKNALPLPRQGLNRPRIVTDIFQQPLGPYRFRKENCSNTHPGIHRPRSITWCAHAPAFARIMSGLPILAVRLVRDFTLIRIGIPLRTFDPEGRFPRLANS